MINTKDVVTLRIPFPTIRSDLAIQAHMYICFERDKTKKYLVKCQTYKFSMITGDNPVVRNWIKEYPDISRNPFRRATLIDLDKKFCLSAILPLSLLASARRDICEDLYSELINKVTARTTTLHIPDDEISLINSRVYSC